MDWTRILSGDPGGLVPLRQRIDTLFTQQRATWPMLRDGEAALTALRRKPLELDGESILVQYNPARRQSTTAKTDAQSVAARPCFLCPQNMPAEERGMTFEDLVVMPNPFPVLPMHCTIAANEHTPQRLAAGRIGQFLRLTKAIGPDLAALYNGPRCGASAPDHFHFQAALANEIPLLKQLPDHGPGQSITAHSSFGRQMLVLESADAAALENLLAAAIRELGSPDAAADEPLLNLIGHYDGHRYHVIVFPRAAHRPACFFATGGDQLTVSPAVLEMGGVLVTTVPEHFDRVVAEIARGIYDEVSAPAKVVEQIAARLA
ncbi:MAG: DUF4922 domain-containing protein [Pirellulales bacterium]